MAEAIKQDSKNDLKEMSVSKPDEDQVISERYRGIKGDRVRPPFTDRKCRGNSASALICKKRSGSGKSLNPPKIGLWDKDMNLEH
jgi:hypothetical protein